MALMCLNRFPIPTLTLPIANVAGFRDIPP